MIYRAHGYAINPLASPGSFFIVDNDALTLKKEELGEGFKVELGAHLDILSIIVRSIF